MNRNWTHAQGGQSAVQPVAERTDLIAGKGGQWLDGRNAPSESLGDVTKS